MGAFDLTGTLDTSGYGLGPSPHKTDPDGTGPLTAAANGEEYGNVAVDSVCAAFWGTPSAADAEAVLGPPMVPPAYTL